MHTRQASRHTPSESTRDESSADEVLTFGQRIDRISRASRMAWNGGCDVAKEIRHAVDVQARVDRNPFAMLAIAAGSGYVLAGGLLSPLSARVAVLGIRLGAGMIAMPLFQRKILDFAEAALAPGAGGNRARRRTSDTTTTNEKETIE